MLSAPNAAPQPAAPEIIATPGVVELGKSIAQDEGKAEEQALAAEENKRLNTPAGSLERYMRMPHKEIRYANGITRIETSLGSVCFQPVPIYARDMPGLFGIPTTCPK